MTEPTQEQLDALPLFNGGIQSGKLLVRIAESPEDIARAQKLRYRVFYEERGAKPIDDMEKRAQDYDAFDEIADHLIILDTSIEDPEQQIVGNYRLLRQEVAEKHGRYYSASEYDISPIIENCSHVLELGRSCVDADYRTRPVLQLLWQGIAEYVMHYGVTMLFGCASFDGNDVEKLAPMLSYLHHYHRAPEYIRARALPEHYVELNRMPKDQLDPKKIMREVPPLIKGYLRIGAFIGDGAYVDEQFNTTDVCIILKTAFVTDRYRSHYETSTKRELKTDPIKDALADLSLASV